MKKNKAGNDEKGMWGRREITIQSMMASRTCPLSKDLKEGRVAPHAFRERGFQAAVSRAKVPRQVLV